MKKFLLRPQFKIIGVIILTIGTILGILYLGKWLPPGMWRGTVYSIFQGRQTNTLTDEVITILIVTGGFMAGFAREGKEGDYIRDLRLSSLAWAVFIYFALVLFLSLQVYDFKFVQFQSINSFTIIYVYLIRFNFILYRRNRQQK